MQEYNSTNSVLLDGGWGTQFQIQGLTEYPDVWNLTNPHLVRQVAEAYIEAGSEIILTNTFSANKFALGRHGYENELDAINWRGVELSKQAGGAKVFASMGPTGLMLMTANVSETEIYDAFLKQAESLAKAEPDGIVIETMSDALEAAIAIRAAKTTGLPVAACLVFDSGKNKDRTMMGTTPEQGVTILSDADIIGANCGQGIEGFLPICKRLRAATDKPIWIKPNAGQPELSGTTVIYHQMAENFAKYAMQLVEAGANFIGGCCGTTPEFIAAIRKNMQS